MSNNNYNYDIEHTFAKYGGEADKGVATGARGNELLQ